MPELRDAEQSVLIEVEPAAEGSTRPRRLVDKTFRRYDQDQPLLLAPDLRDWLPADHPARWVDDLVEHGLDLAPFYDDYREARGAGRPTVGAPAVATRPSQHRTAAVEQHDPAAFTVSVPRDSLTFRGQVEQRRADPVLYRVTYRPETSLQDETVAAGSVELDRHGRLVVLRVWVPVMNQPREVVMRRLAAAVVSTLEEIPPEG